MNKEVVVGNKIGSKEKNRKPQEIPPCDAGFKKQDNVVVEAALEYDILSEITYEDLIVAVNAAIKEDWSPQGGVVSTVEFRFLQSMTRVVSE